MKKLQFPFYRQHDSMDCGPTCLRMISKYHGKNYSLSYLHEKSFLNREGTSLLGISDAAEAIGLRTIAIRTTYDKLKEDVPLPCIAHWKQEHFIVIHNIKKDKIYVADPAFGLLKYSKEEFLKGWIGSKVKGKDKGSLLLARPSPDFYQKEDEGKKNRRNFKIFFSYLLSYKKFLVQLVFGLFLGSLLQLIVPFLTQSLVDFGIRNQSMGFVYLILLAQFMFLIGRSSVDFIRSWILLHVGTRINISIISDFLIKLMKLPILFFDKKKIGDILQRIGDHRRIEILLTSTTLNVLFSMFNLLVYGIVIAIYSMEIFVIFFLSSIAYIAWILIFLKKRRELDYRNFSQRSENQSKLIQIIQGMQEIKLSGIEKQKRWEWENIQSKLFKVNVKSLSLNQFQQGGALFVNGLKNIVITFLAAKEVIEGSMTLGMMMAVLYIMGQLNSPINQLISFITTTQDAKISLERLGEIYDKEDEPGYDTQKIIIFPEDKGIYIKNVDFQYEGPDSEYVLKKLNFGIPMGEKTAIVGISGSGKTTLLKLLLKFYDPIKGKIYIGKTNLMDINTRLWRQNCGVVMQDGFIFSDTIVRNITMGRNESIEKHRLMEAVRMANIKEFIESLPLGYSTKIGPNEIGLSQGQKQRILIARAVYKNPEYIFFDEATNALDANNEQIIMENLEEFFEGKTVIIIAHRLSSVKKAEQIVVLDKGRIVEHGNHKELANLKGVYYSLVKDQLDLGD